MKYEVIRYMKNGNIESDDETFNTKEQAEGWATYTWGHLTDKERAKYTSFEVMETDIPTLKEAREEMGYTRRQAAALVGVPIRTWEKWENGERTPAPYLEKLIIFYLENN